MTEPFLAPYLPREMDDVTRAFPAHALEFMPAWEDIPEEWRDHNNPHSRLIAHWFFKGWSEKAQFHARPGIDAEMAFWHIQSICRSFAPKHQHKEASMAYLAGLWFSRVEDGKDVWTLVDPSEAGAAGEEADHQQDHGDDQEPLETLDGEADSAEQ